MRPVELDNPEYEVSALTLPPADFARIAHLLGGLRLPRRMVARGWSAWAMLCPYHPDTGRDLYFCRNGLRRGTWAVACAKACPGVAILVTFLMNGFGLDRVRLEHIDTLPQNWPAWLDALMDEKWAEAR